MVMTLNVRLKAGRISAELHFANQTRTYQRVKAVVNRGSGHARIVAIDYSVNLFGGGMTGMLQQVLKYSISLSSAAQTAIAERGRNRCAYSSHSLLRLNLDLD